MDTLIQDVRFAARYLVRRRATSLIAVLTLGLGIGANTAMFSLLEATLFKPADAEQPGQLRWVAGARPSSSRYQTLSYPDYREIRDQVPAFNGLLAYTTTWIALGGATPVRVPGQVVSGNYFDVLGIRAAHGRTFRPDEDGAPGQRPVVVLTDAFWRRHFAADPRVVDSAIVVNGQPFTVIGIAPPGFRGIEIQDEAPLAMWIPLAMADQAMPGQAFLTSRGAVGLRIVGRMNADAGNAQAQAMLDVVASRRGAGAAGDDLRESRFVLLPLVGTLDPTNRSELAPVFGLLLIVPLLVLATACANAANVLLARALERRRELAMRRALGASRPRLVGQLLTESVLLALFAGGAGVLLSFWLTALVARLGDVPDAIAAIITPDGRVLAATTVLATAAGILFGLAPALAATRMDLTPAIKDAAGGVVGGRGRHRLRDAFVVGQVAVSLVLLIAAGLFMQSLSKMLRVDPGYDARRGLAVSFDLGLLGYTPERQAVFERELLAGVRALPGVEAAALASVVPFGGRMVGETVLAADAGDDHEVFVLTSHVTAGYFDTLGVRVLRGRAFTERDDASSPMVAIVNETLARRLWGDADPIGKRFRSSGERQPLLEVVGVARDGKYDDLAEDGRSFVYRPLRQAPSPVLTLLVRTGPQPEALSEPIARATRRLDPHLPLYRASTFAQLVRAGADKRQAAAAMLGVFGALALSLAALGIYGVTAHGVSLRTREIGIRMSLGARARDVLALFVREGASRTAVGVAIGLAVSVAASRVMAGFLFGLKATDALTFAGAAALLCGVAALATYFPARKAARVDPMVALRND